MLMLINRLVFLHRCSHLTMCLCQVQTVSLLSKVKYMIFRETTCLKALEYFQGTTWRAQSTRNAHLTCPAKFWPRLARSCQDLAEILGQKLAKILARSGLDPDKILKSQWPKSRRDSCQDLGEISKSWQPKTSREPRRDLKEDLAEILAEILIEISKSCRQKTLAEKLAILPRYQNVYTQIQIS